MRLYRAWPARSGEQCSGYERDDAKHVEQLNVNELVVVEKAIKAVPAQQLVRHPRIQKEQHGPNEHKRVKGIAAAVKGDEHAAHDDEDHGKQEELKHALPPLRRGRLGGDPKRAGRAS